MDIEKSIEKKRIIYNTGFWDSFWTLLIPVFILILLMFNCIILFMHIYEHPNNKYYWIVFFGTSVTFSFLTLLVILYFKIDKLSIMKMGTRTRNKKLILDYLEDSKFEILNTSNSFIEVNVKSRLIALSYRRLIIIFDGNSIYYNCTTFENVNTGKWSYNNFKSPIYWFANKNVERRLKNYLLQFL